MRFFEKFAEIRKSNVDTTGAEPNEIFIPRNMRFFEKFAENRRRNVDTSGTGPDENTFINKARDFTQTPTVVRFVGIAVITVGVACIAAPIIVNGLGFGAVGVAKGALAAKIQAVWFGSHIAGPTGAMFGACQGVGAAGFGLKAKLIVVFGGLMVAKIMNENKAPAEELNENKKVSPEELNGGSLEAMLGAFKGVGAAGFVLKEKLLKILNENNNTESK